MKYLEYMVNNRHSCECHLGFNKCWQDLIIMGFFVNIKSSTVKHTEFISHSATHFFLEVGIYIS